MNAPQVASKIQAAERRTGVLFVGSPLFPEDAANELVARTRALTDGGLKGQLKLADRLGRDRASCAAALQSLDIDTLDGLVVQTSTFCPAELLSEVLSAIGHRRLPIAIWALEEDNEIVTNSLCGAQLWASTLLRYGIRSSLLIGNPENGEVARDLAAFAAAARAFQKIDGSRMALVGAHADWFTNLAVDPWVLKRLLNVTVEQISLPRFIATCKADEVAERKAAERWAEASFDGGDAENSRLILGRTCARLEAGFNSIQADAVAIRDWPEILYAPDFKGTWAALGELSDRAVPIAPEGDVMGALTALAIRGFDAASLPFLTDISGLDRANNRLVLWHYGVSPRLADGPRSLDPVLKQETFPLKAGPLTLLRLSIREDGKLRLFVAEGEVEAEHPKANRAAGFFRAAKSGAEALVRGFVEAGYEHHVTAVYGHWADAALHLARQIGAEVDRA
ncbi:hypothetical protein GCM10011385_19750 [Nitratireductor aestuarii]|uniref:L-fucose isomerase C-terminal domain-containing protein n=1 Tax=Nitratireductor aestuarii TaxID=1735103 RepID=A0A916RRT7_9HYPH|nr:hypothetical protein [Nitratireductor aestuarii]GGA65884.1 hypothetical protein GCM10011385_19750 [Nitratireductor aestuarii]HWK32086.1 hypothetical protein [Hyphomicrobium sp.]